MITDTYNKIRTKNVYAIGDTALQLTDEAF
jgi:hypothetical protein